ncbi:hypothetical protein J7394_21185 [Ruegeria sp. R13_0]|uniref:hypothetical protein n=1 Tax=Ruegeria sp. R13_0 TaxID=2821099 RepID=UPI001ADD1E32|nr:hypothetical protein [Ruegeria sp. R13_0]MBO9436730.1 hypothetical protein [Ruegeria sp. R13_0]
MSLKNRVARALLSTEAQTSWLGPLLRSTIQATNGLYRYSPEFKLATQAVDRPHYSWCMMRAAELGKMLGHQRISAIEFGVAGGNGLAYMCDYADEVKRATGVDVVCYGFDTGEGMPPPEGSADLPYWFAEKQYVMDVDAIKAQVPNGKIILGNIRDSIDGFLEEYSPPPIGAIFNDTDYWSSTRESFRLFDHCENRPEHFLPRQFMYFDDIIGTEIEMYGTYNGQLRAIEEFNSSQNNVKIQRNQNLLNKTQYKWRFQIYYAHLFLHSDYDKYIGGARQEAMQDLLKLKA